MQRNVSDFVVELLPKNVLILRFIDIYLELVFSRSIQIWTVNEHVDINLKTINELLTVNAILNQIFYQVVQFHTTKITIVFPMYLTYILEQEIVNM